MHRYISPPFLKSKMRRSSCGSAPRSDSVDLAEWPEMILAEGMTDEELAVVKRWITA
jgi:hypothetical protein